MQFIFNNVLFILFFKQELAFVKAELEFQKRKNEEMLELYEGQSIAAAITISSMIANNEDFQFLVDVSSSEYVDLKAEAENMANKYV